MKAKLTGTKIFVFEKRHYKVENGQNISKLPKGLLKIMKEQGMIKEDKDGNKIRK